jgi:hypothetical protein
MYRVKVFLMTGNPFKAGPLRVPILIGQTRIRAKRPLHMDRVKLRLHRWVWPQDPQFGNSNHLMTCFPWMYHLQRAELCFDQYVKPFHEMGLCSYCRLSHLSLFLNLLTQDNNLFCYRSSKTQML